MANEAIKEILKKESSRFTSEELEAIMDEEIDKPLEQMDVELVDMCVDLLTQRLDEKEGDNDKIKPISTTPAKPHTNKNNKKFIKIIVAAILVSAFFAIMAGAGVIKIPEGLFRFDGNSYKLNSESDEIYSDLATELKKHNLEDLVLPKYLYDECKISGFEVVEDEESKFIQFVFNQTDSRFNGIVDIESYNSNYNFDTNFIDANVNKYVYVDSLVVNDIDVRIYANKTDYLIYYNHDYVNYYIYAYDTTVDQIVNFSETII